MLHYSLFRCKDTSGDTIVIDLSALVKVEYQQSSEDNITAVGTLAYGRAFALVPHDADKLVEAWNIFKIAYNCQPLVESGGNFISSCQAATRQDSFLGQIISESQKMMAEDCQ